MRYLLGGFIVLQLVFLLVANVGSVALYLSTAGNSGAAAIWSTIADNFSEPYAHLTGQEQYWRMFAPAVPPRAMFVRLVGDFHMQIPSEFEPAGSSWLHWPGPGERIWHVEKSLAAPFAIYHPEEVRKRPDEWRTYLKARIGVNRHRYLAFMDWKSRRFLQSVNEKREPEQIDLLVSVHTASWYDRPSLPEHEVLTLRWRPRDDSLSLCTESDAGAVCVPLEK